MKDLEEIEEKIKKNREELNTKITRRTKNVFYFIIGIVLIGLSLNLYLYLTSQF